MSLRVATACANALSWSLKVPLAGIHLSDLWYARSQSSPLKAHRLIWLHSTKKDSLFIRGFGDLAKKWPEPTLISIEELRAELIAESSPLPFVGELIPEHKALFSLLTPYNHVLPLLEALPRTLADLQYEQASLQPWYGRGA